MTYYARSASASSPNQTYSEHIENVSEYAKLFWTNAARYWCRHGKGDAFGRIIYSACAFHDLGKLDDSNQQVLKGRNPRAPLPIPHQDAGVAHLLSQEEIHAALFVYAHHIGLPDFGKIRLQDPPMRISDSVKRAEIDALLPTLLHRHAACGFDLANIKDKSNGETINAAFDLRISFSCLTDSDHGDASSTAWASPVDFPPPSIALSPAKRLKALKQHIAALPLATTDKGRRRNEIRSAFFESCLESSANMPITACDAPVGTGKTTAVIAHLLRTAQANGLRRIFVILPFTNIIQQSVKVYRDALVLPGENPEEVVAEIHHRADYQDRTSRQLTARWNAPVIVTTAVAFFETLASNRPATLRRLHNLPGSAIFLDEAHAMLPAKLLPLAWHWINHTATTWQCYWTLASGSLNRFWELEEFAHPNASSVPNILPPEKQALLASAEATRIVYGRKAEVLSLAGLATWLYTLEGPVLAVLNTVHTAAAAAREAEKKFGVGNVLHLSTALSPADREKTLNAVRKRLRCKKQTKWCLVATSCVEAGMDFSFRTGVRECASLASLLQLAGRVNRNSEWDSADVWTVSLSRNDPDVVANPAWSCASRVLSGFFERGVNIEPSLCTEAMKRELREQGISSELECLRKAEATCAFETVEKKFRVIQDDSAPVVVDKTLIEKIERFEDVSWRDIQNGSVQIRSRLREYFALEESKRHPGVFFWKNDYSPFLGYMEGVLRQTLIDRNSMAIV